jgi:hypothetical protein
MSHYAIVNRKVPAYRRTFSIQKQILTFPEEFLTDE